LTSGCFRKAKRQGLLFGNEFEKRSVKSRPKAASDNFLIELLVHFGHRTFSGIAMKNESRVQRSFEGASSKAAIDRQLLKVAAIG